MDSCTFTNQADSHTPKVEIHTRPKLCYFQWSPCCESEAILSKTFRPGYLSGVFIWENVSPGYRDLGSRASPASHMNTSIFLQRKKCHSPGEARSQEPSQPGRPAELI